MPKSPVRTPTYRQRSGYDQAIVTLTDAATGKRRDVWLGKFGSLESREKYHRVIAAWEANGRNFPALILEPPSPTAPAEPDRTVLHLIRAYWHQAKKYYRPDEVGTLKVALRLLRQHHGSEPATSFGPVKLRALREEMIRGNPAMDPPRQPWSRSYINAQCRRIRQMFRWAASHEMIPASVCQALATVEPLKRGRTAAREAEPVGPVPMELVDAVKPFVSRQVAALIDLQLLTGARGGELVKLRPIDIDTTHESGVWTYRPKEHKSAHRGKDRTLYFGPAAQAVLRPLLQDRPVTAYLFSPAEAEVERRAKARRERKTPLSCGTQPGDNRSVNSPRQFRDYYHAKAYGRAVARACEQAFPPPEHLRPTALPDGSLETETMLMARLGPFQQAELAKWRSDHHWHPHQLRHAAATNIRRQFGLEAAQVILGHSSPVLTDAIYAERDAGKAVEAMRRIG